MSWSQWKLDIPKHHAVMLSSAGMDAGSTVNLLTHCCFFSFKRFNVPQKKGEKFQEVILHIQTIHGFWNSEAV